MGLKTFLTKSENIPSDDVYNFKQIDEKWDAYIGLNLLLNIMNTFAKN